MKTKRILLMIMCVCIVVGLAGCSDVETFMKDYNISVPFVTQTQGKDEVNTGLNKVSTNDPGYVSQGLVEEGFHSDWREGHENYYGYGQAEDWNRSGYYNNFVVQDQWLYYSNYTKIYKMPIGGKANDIQVLYDIHETYDGKKIRIAVVKDWIYFCIDFDGLYRIRTDGNVIEKLIDAEEMNTYDNDGVASFHIIGDKVYYIATKQESASMFSHYLASMDVNTNQKEMLDFIELNSTNHNYGGSDLYCGFENQIIIDKCEGSANQECWLVDVKKKTKTAIKTSDGEFMHVNSLPTMLIGDQRLFYFKHAWNDSKNGQEYWKDRGLYVDCDTWERQYFEKNYPKYKEGELLASFYPSYYDYKNMLVYRYLNNQFECYSFKTYNTNRINGDAPSFIIAGFDDYIYYRLQGEKELFRVKPNGKDFEKVNWMFP
jgi:hypothetical protein